MTKIKIIIFFVMNILYANEYTSKGSQEFGGMCNISASKENHGNSKYSTLNLNINPFYHYFIINQFYLGPAISYRYEKLYDIDVYKHRSNTVGLGLECGFEIKVGSALALFIQPGYLYSIYSSTDIQHPYDSSTYNSKIHQISGDIGLKIIIGHNIAINIASGLTYFNENFKLQWFKKTVLTDNAVFKNERYDFRIINIGLSGLIY